MVKTSKHSKRELVEQIGVRLDADKMKELAQIADAERRPIGQLCRIVIEDFLARRKQGVAA